MDINNWLAYLSVITILIAIPGPASLLVTMHGYQYGFNKTNHTIIGNLLGSLILMTISVLGLSMIFSTSEFIFSLTKYIGASYLLYLGIKTIYNKNENKGNQQHVACTNPSNWDLLKQGVLTGVSNPKDILFFTALFPAFLSSDRTLPIQLSILVSTWLLMDYAFKIIYLQLGKTINHKFSNPEFLTVFNRITGGIFITFAITLASSNSA